jgi:hypothetical protein
MFVQVVSHLQPESNIRRHIALQLGGMGNLVTFMDYLSGNAGRDVSVTS